jgi:protein TonB
LRTILIDLPPNPSYIFLMHTSTNQAVGYSLGLHLLMAILLVAVRGGIPISPNLVMVEWVETVPSLGTDEATSSPNLGATTKPVMSQSKPFPAATESGLKAASDTAAAANTISAESKARRMSAEEFYRASVRQTLEQKKIYPPLARRLGQTGTVVLKFKLGKDGSLLSAELAEACPYPVLNEAAKNLVSSSKFQPIPDELEKSSWEFTLPVEYRLDGKLTAQVTSN